MFVSREIARGRCHLRCAIQTPEQVVEIGNIKGIERRQTEEATE